MFKSAMKLKGFLGILKNLIGTHREYSGIIKFPILFFIFNRRKVGKIVKVPLKNNKHIYIHHGSYEWVIFREVFLKETYKKYLRGRKFDVAIDIGAHVGFTTCLMAEYAKKIYSIEPDPYNFRMLEKNIEGYNIQKQAKIFNLAIWDENKEIIIYLCPENTAANRMFPSSTITEENPKIRVHAKTLKDFILENNIESIDLLKIDVEGAEYAILYSLDDEIFEKIRSIIMEFHIYHPSHDEIQLINFLKEKGYFPDLKYNSDHSGMIYARKVFNS